MPKYQVSYNCLYAGVPDTGMTPIDTGDVVIKSVAFAISTGLGPVVQRLVQEQGHDITNVQITRIELMEVLP